MSPILSFAPVRTVPRKRVEVPYIVSGWYKGTGWFGEDAQSIHALHWNYETGDAFKDVEIQGIESIESRFRVDYRRHYYPLLQRPQQSGYCLVIDLEPRRPWEHQHAYVVLLTDKTGIVENEIYFVLESALISGWPFIRDACIGYNGDVFVLYFAEDPAIAQYFLINHYAHNGRFVEKYTVIRPDDFDSGTQGVKTWFESITATKDHLWLAARREEWQGDPEKILGRGLVRRYTFQDNGTIIPNSYSESGYFTPASRPVVPEATFLPLTTSVLNRSAFPLAISHYWTAQLPESKVHGVGIYMVDDNLQSYELPETPPPTDYFTPLPELTPLGFNSYLYLLNQPPPPIKYPFTLQRFNVGSKTWNSNIVTLTPPEGFIFTDFFSYPFSFYPSHPKQ